MGKFAELCKGKTMGAFFLLLLSSRKTLSRMEEDQTYPLGEHRFYQRDIVNCDDFTECG